MRFRPQFKAAVWAVSMALTAGPAMAGGWGVATQGDTGQGVDTVIGNGLNPRGLDTTLEPDSNGLGAFRSPVAHTPTGSPYSVPWAEPEEASMHASMEVGYLNTSGDDKAAKLIEYRDLHSGLMINNFNFNAANGNRYFNFYGGGVGRDDQYFGGATGVYNDWRVTAFYNETPHVFTTTARSIWSGDDTNRLTLQPALQFTRAVGGTNPNTIADSIRTLVAATPESTIELIRKKGGMRFDYVIDDQWNFYANYTLEKRKGGRPWGQTGGGFPGASATNAPSTGFSNANGQPVEMVEPIDYNSQEFRTGLSYADSVSALNLSLSASIFKDAIKQVVWENPYDSPTATNSRHFQQFTTPPDNEAYYLNLDYQRALDFWRGSFNTTLSYGRQSQNDVLQPYTTATGVFGATPENDMAYWNSTVGPNGLPTLSRDRAGLHNNVSLASFGLALHPTSKLTLDGKFRFSDFAQHNDFLDCNPSLAATYNTTCTPGNGSTAPIYGFLVEDAYTTAFGLPGGAPQNSSGAGVGGKVRSFDTSSRQLNGSIGADYKVDRNLSVNASYERENVHRSEREREWTHEDKYKIGLVDRNLLNGTLRTSLEYDRRTGDTWKMDSYMAANCANFFVDYLSCQQTYISPTGTPASTSVPPANGKYDLADRNQLVFAGRYSYPFSDTLDGMVTAKVKNESYPQAGSLPAGRQKRRENTLSVELNYQPSTTTGGFISATYQSVDQSQWSILPGGAESGCTEALYLAGGCNAVIGAPGSIYQNLGQLDQFRYETNEKNWFLNLGANHMFGTVRFDANYTYSDTKSPMTYLLNDVTGTRGGSVNAAFPDMEWIRHQLNLSATVPINAQASAHLLYKFDKAQVADWHYDGLNAYNNELGGRYYLDAGQAQPYKAHTVGVFLQYRM